MTISRLDKKRFRLKCALCSGKGACVECKHGKCRIAAHPWCVLHNPRGFTKRVIKDEDDSMLWQIFCSAHATSVSEPLKPKPKSKMVQQLAAAPIPCPETMEDKAKERERERERAAKKALDARNSLPQLSMAHSVRKISLNSTGRKSLLDAPSNQPIITLENPIVSQSESASANEEISGRVSDAKKSPIVTGKKVRGPYKKKGAAIKEDKERDSDIEDVTSRIKEKEREKEKEKQKGGQKDRDREKDNVKFNGKGKQITFSESVNEVRTSPEHNTPSAAEASAEIIDLSASSGYSLLTLNEWPGQSEGEAMDLDHFWKVAAMQYPEDHPVEVRNRITQCNATQRNATQCKRK